MPPLHCLYRQELPRPNRWQKRSARRPNRENYRKPWGVRRYVVQYLDVPLLHGHCSQHVGRELVARTEEVSGIAVGLHHAKAALQLVNIEGEFERFHHFLSIYLRRTRIF